MEKAGSDWLTFKTKTGVNVDGINYPIIARISWRLLLFSTFASLLGATTFRPDKRQQSAVEALGSLWGGYQKDKLTVRKKFRKGLSELLAKHTTRISVIEIGAAIEDPDFEDRSGFCVEPYNHFHAVKRSVAVSGGEMAQVLAAIKAALASGTADSPFKHNAAFGLILYADDKKIYSTSFDPKTGNFWVMYPGGIVDYDWVAVDRDIIT